MPKLREELESFDLVIVGAGIVGSCLAAAIGKEPLFSKWSVGLIDAAPAPKTYQGKDFDPRVVALTRKSEDLLKDLGVWSSIQARACAYRNMVVWDGEGTAEIEFSSQDLPLDKQQESLGHIVENSAILSELLRKIDTCSNIALLRGESVEEISQEPLTGKVEEPFAELEFNSGRQIKAKLVVAADGANSKVRQFLNMPTREWEYGHTAIVTTVRAERPHQFTAWQRFMASGPLAFLPLPEINGEQGYCSIVWSVETERAVALMALDDEEFAKALEQAFERRLGAIEFVAQRFSFPLRQRHATRYVQPGAALIGDAAHTIHPLAGQGVNLGLLDVQALLQEFRRAEQRSLPISDFSIVQRYQRERMGHNLAMMGLMESFKHLFASQNPALQVARNWGLSKLQKLKPLKMLIMKRAMGL